MQYRSHICNELRPEHVGQKVTLSGWVHRKRDHGNLIFVDLRDRYGITQVLFDPEVDKNAWHTGEGLKPEYVIQVTGTVQKRMAGAENKDLPTGEIEVEVNEIIVLNTSETPPFEIDQERGVNEELRLKYRYLDLRRDRPKNNIIMRHKITKFMRDFFDDKGFLEVETPILLKGTPEGAREFLVPSRLYPGKFYVLPQSPQQLKQLLMVAGFDRYFQIARCFRDEDQRGDRQPEFTQLDIEMSFVNSHDVMNMIEDMVLKLVSTFYPDRPVLSTPMPRMTWHEAMEKYGSDRPDLRFGMEIVDVAEAVKGSEFQVFQKTLDEKGSIKALCVKGGANFSRKDIDDLTEIAKGQGAKGLAYITFTNEGPKSPILKFLSDEIVKKVETICQAKEGDIVFFAADEFLTACQSLGSVRLEIGKKMHLQDENVLAFCWVYNFPLYERDKQTGGLTSSHHPFTHPLIEHLALLDSEPEKVLGEQYDIVLNGVEIGGGTIRIHVPDLQKKIFQILGISDEDAERRFGHMLKAFGYGAPPHGGIALGLDRVIMILQKEPNIREIIPFPKDQKAKDLMTGAPDIVPDAQIREACIMVPEEYKIAAEE